MGPLTRALRGRIEIAVDGALVEAAVAQKALKMLCGTCAKAKHLRPYQIWPRGADGDRRLSLFARLSGGRSGGREQSTGKYLLIPYPFGQTSIPLSFSTLRSFRMTFAMPSRSCACASP